MKQKRFASILVALALMAMLIPTAYAYMVHKSQTVANSFVPAYVDCEIEEAFDGENKSSIQVKNTSNIDAYIRVRLVFYWVDSKGNVVARNMVPPTVTCDNDWIKGDAFTYYYKHVVEPGAPTKNLLSASISMNPVVETVTGTQYFYYPVVEVMAEAIQSLPETAVEEAWDVTIVDKVITNA